MHVVIAGQKHELDYEVDAEVGASSKWIGCAPECPRCHTPLEATVSYREFMGDLAVTCDECSTAIVVN